MIAIGQRYLFRFQDCEDSFIGEIIEVRDMIEKIASIKVLCVVSGTWFRSYLNTILQREDLKRTEYKYLSGQDRP